MKILHVCETLSPRFGGPVTIVRSLAAAQQRAGHQVEIITTNAEYPRGKYCAPGDGVLENSTVWVHYVSVEFQPLKVSLGLVRRLKMTMSAFDIVHVHGLYRFPQSFAARYARNHRVPYVITPHGSLDPYMYSKSTAGSVWLKRLYERWFDFPNLNAAGAIHYTTEDERKGASLLKLRAPPFVVPNGLDWSKYERLPKRGRLRSKWGIGEAPMVLFLGRLHFVKGLDLLVPAFDALRHKLPDAKLVIAGPDNDGYEKEVHGWARERGLDGAVKFADLLFGKDVTQAYVDADVFVLPSYAENFGMTVAEALACKLPVVISDQVNIHAEVEQAQAGLVTHCNSNEIANALEMLIRDATRRRTMGEAGRRLVQERWTWSAIVDQLTAEYEKVIKQPRWAKQSLSD